MKLQCVIVQTSDGNKGGFLLKMQPMHTSENVLKWLSVIPSDESDSNKKRLATVMHRWPNVCLKKATGHVYQANRKIVSL